MVAFNFLLALLGLLPLVVQGMWTMPCFATVLRERIDPIFSPGAVSSHLNRVVGGSGINFTMTDPNTTVLAGCSSCSVGYDKSSYWVPQLYHNFLVDGDNDTHFVLATDDDVNIVYNQVRFDADESVLAFPPGLTMTTGNSNRRNFINDTMSNAISFECPDQANITAYHNLPLNCSTIVAKVHFPSCWNGKDLNFPDRFSHMSYPEDGYNSGKCPSSHPVRLVSLSYEFGFKVLVSGRKWANPPLVFSTGDATGYGLYGGFVNGWTESVLQKAIDSCNDTSSGNIATTCHILNEWTPEQNKDCRVPSRVRESITEVVRLPGCNPLNSSAAGAYCGEVQPEILDFELYFQDLTGHDWYYAGCADLDPLGTGPNDTWVGENSKMAPETCMNYCIDPQNKPSSDVHDANWFSIQGDICRCAVNGPSQDDTPLEEYLGNCNHICSGTTKYLCGGSNSSSLYKLCPKEAQCSNYEFKQLTHNPSSINRPGKRFESFETNVTGSTEGTFIQDTGRDGAVLDVYEEGPLTASMFVGYKVCARNYVDPSHPFDHVSCYVFQGYRPENVAATFIQWAIKEYNLNASSTFLTPEDTIEARLASQLTTLHNVGPTMLVHVFMAVVSLFAFVLISSLISLAMLHYIINEVNKASRAQDNHQLVKKIMKMDPTARDKIFERYEAEKQRLKQEKEHKSLCTAPKDSLC